MSLGAHYQQEEMVTVSLERYDRLLESDKYWQEKFWKKQAVYDEMLKHLNKQGLMIYEDMIRGVQILTKAQAKKKGYYVEPEQTAKQKKFEPRKPKANWKQVTKHSKDYQ